MRFRIIAVVAAFGVLITAGIASANGEDTDPRIDTLFTYGYDAQTQLFFFNTHITDSTPLDCTLSGTFNANYGQPTVEDGTVPVEGLSGDGENPVIFEETGYDLAEGVEEAADSAPYTAAGVCGISGIAVESDMNHGQFMKLFKESIDMRGRGCLNRWLAKSGLGKDDPEATAPEFTDPVIGFDGSIDFTTVETDCIHGNQDKAEDHPGRGHKTDETDADATNGHGRPDAPGKSDKAPGRDKDK
jgi:hypothetical protein